jgi:hypothetical protein
MWPITGLQ